MRAPVLWGILILVAGFAAAHLTDYAHRWFVAWRQRRLAAQALARGPSLPVRMPRAERRRQAKNVARQYAAFMGRARSSAE